MTALFNAPSCVIGLMLGAVLGAFIVENGKNHTHLKEQVAHANQIVADCEAELPRNLRCELTAKVIK